MSKSRIVIVEDEAIVALDLENRLTLLGYDVVASAVSGREAIELVKKHSPDLIIMDIMLAGEMDGIQTAAQIRQFTEIPTIFLTAYTDSTTLTRATEFAPAGYIIKPYEDRELRVTIDIALARKAARQKDLLYKEWFQVTLENHKEMVLTTNPSGVLIAANSSAERYFSLHTHTDIPLEQLLIGKGINIARAGDSITFSQQQGSKVRTATGTVQELEGKTGPLGSIYTVQEETGD
ncbi:MAG: response regulator [Desulfovibrio sp.]